MRFSTSYRTEQSIIGRDLKHTYIQSRSTDSREVRVDLNQNFGFNDGWEKQVIGLGWIGSIKEEKGKSMDTRNGHGRQREGIKDGKYQFIGKFSKHRVNKSLQKWRERIVAMYGGHKTHGVSN